MKNKFAFIIAPVVFCWCLFSLLGCKDPILENKQLLTSDDYLNGNKDTLHVKIFSEFEKPLVSSGISVGVLGNLNDQILEIHMQELMRNAGLRATIFRSEIAC